jgi:hypothetical protein
VGLVVVVIMSQFTQVGRVGTAALIVALATGLPSATAYAASSSTAPVASATASAASTASAGATTVPAGSAAYRQTLLIFGTFRPDGGPDVTTGQFWEFVDQVVTPRFPDGLTVSDAQGQWRDRYGVIERERSFEVYLLYPVASAAQDGMAIEEIRRLYKQRFAQEAVARIDEPEQVEF